MPRKDPKGDVRTNASRPTDTAAFAASAGGSVNSSLALAQELADSNRRRGCTALSNLFLRDDGWLRAAPARDGKALYLKWKFTHGKWVNHYVMVVVHVWEWDVGMELLEEKVAQVFMGSRVPTVDTWYNQHRDGKPAE